MGWSGVSRNLRLDLKKYCKRGKKGKTYYKNWSREWLKAYEGYNYWKRTQCFILNLQAHLGIKEGVAKSLHRKFREGWVPTKDKEFMKEFKLNG